MLVGIVCAIKSILFVYGAQSLVFEQPLEYVRRIYGKKGKINHFSSA